MSHERNPIKIKAHYQLKGEEVFSTPRKYLKVSFLATDENSLPLTDPIQNLSKFNFDSYKSIQNLKAF